MKHVLIGCEVSGVVRRAFSSFNGIKAVSCDLLPAEDGSPYHLQMDLKHVISNYWDAAICFPDFTYLCGSGMHWTTRGLRDPTLITDALKFFAFILSRSHIPFIAVENPVGIVSTELRKPDQYIQPYEYGHDASKKTGLWLKNLPPLVPDPADYVKPRLVMHEGKLRERWSNQTDSGQNKLGPSDDRWIDRARTYEGVALAMAEQWAPIILAA